MMPKVKKSVGNIVMTRKRSALWLKCAAGTQCLKITDLMIFNIFYLNKKLMIFIG